MYPKFELIKAEEGKDWVVRAITCEMPVFDLGDYKEKLKGAGKAKSIWTPTKAKSGNGENEKDHELSQLEKEQEVMRILLENIKIKIPHILIDDEVNSKLAKLLERLEKLGLSLESYLSSIKKTSEQLRSEYLLQSQQGISLDFILNRIAEEEKIKVDQKDIDQAITAASSDPKIADNLNSPEQKQLIESILRKRSALDYLITLL